PPPAPGPPPERWFTLPQPRPDVLARLRAAPGDDPVLLGMLEAAQTDWDRLFAPGMLDRLIPPMQVAGLTTGFVLGMPEDELRRRLGQIAARGVAFDYAANPVIVSGRACGHTEGYDDPRVLAASVERLRRIGVTVRYLSLDGGLFFGHYAAGGQNCGLDLDETIRDVAITVNAFKAAWPDVVVGEILPTVPLTREADWQASVRAYRDGLARATGKTLAFFELDIAWDNPGWRQSVVAETLLAHRLGAGIAFIYNGDGEDRSDAAWLAHARRNIAEIEGGLNLDPVHVSFATWNPHPTHIVGPPGADTLQALMAYDALPGARLHLAPGPAAITGRVTD
ncbi:hypothetical protein, partial [Acidisphaera rubrifaciens]|uniref:hypothetical protein n=1 Tax=Acidisphaera rubrifaciens TaxID=50715 RepID=UPI000662C13B